MYESVAGILSLEMPLSKQPVLGDWKIKAEAKVSL